MIVFAVLCLGCIAGGIVMFIVLPDKFVIDMLFFIAASIFLFLSLFNLPIKEKEIKYRD